MARGAWFYPADHGSKSGGFILVSHLGVFVWFELRLEVDDCTGAQWHKGALGS